MESHKWFVWILLGISLISGFFYLFSVIFKLYNLIPYFTLIITLTLIPVLSLLLFLIWSIYSYLNSKRLIQELKPTISFNKEIPHHAIIIAKSDWFFKKWGIYTGIDILINELNKHEKPFYIYECETKEKVQRILNCENSKYLWLFGHGFKGGLTFYYKDASKFKILYKYFKLYYKDLIDCERKQFVAQLHCNTGCEISLPEFLAQKYSYKLDYFVIDGFRFDIQNLLDIKYILSEKIKHL